MTTKPVLFLDIDGVLNSYNAFYKAQQGLIVVVATTDVIDPENVAQLNRIVKETGCEVVVSSTWRKIHTLNHIELMLEKAGYDYYLLSTTPQLNVARGKEIEEWLFRHPGFGPIAIVDDDSDMEPFMDRFVKTSFQTGLTAEEADKLISLLLEKNEQL